MLAFVRQAVLNLLSRPCMRKRAMVAAATAMMLAQPASARATKCGVPLATAAPKPVAGAGAGNSDRAPTAVDPLLAASAPAAVAAAIAITTLRQLAHAFTVVALVPRYPVRGWIRFADGQPVAGATVIVAGEAGVSVAPQWLGVMQIAARQAALTGQVGQAGQTGQVGQAGQAWCGVATSNKFAAPGVTSVLADSGERADLIVISDEKGAVDLAAMGPWPFAIEVDFGDVASRYVVRSGAEFEVRLPARIKAEQLRIPVYSADFMIAPCGARRQATRPRSPAKQP